MARKIQKTKHLVWICIVHTYVTLNKISISNKFQQTESYNTQLQVAKRLIKQVKFDILIETEIAQGNKFVTINVTKEKYSFLYSKRWKKCVRTISIYIYIYSCKLKSRQFAPTIRWIFRSKSGRNCWNGSFKLLELHNQGAPGVIEGSESISTIKMAISTIKITISATNCVAGFRQNSPKRCKSSRL